jgi:hypothetical protein
MHKLAVLGNALTGFPDVCGKKGEIVAAIFPGRSGSNFKNSGRQKPLSVKFETNFHIHTHVQPAYLNGRNVWWIYCHLPRRLMTDRYARTAWNISA